jgi:hypothetical protein
MPSWTMIKLVAALVAMLVVGGTIGGYVWNYRHRGEVIEEQKKVIADYKEQARIREVGRKVTTSTLKKQAAIKEKVPYADQAIDAMVPSGDAARALNLLDKYRLPNNPSKPDPPDGGRSGNRPAPGRQALPGPNR